MKSSVVFLGSLVIGYTLLAHSEQVNEMVFGPCNAVKEELIFDDSYQLFLDEKRGLHIHSYAHLEGVAKERIDQKSQFILFNATVKVDQDISEEILRSDADIACLQGIRSHQEGYMLYKALKGLYAHFYVETCDKGISLIASKYCIEDPLFIAFGDDCGLFDFVILNQENPIGHLYFTRLNDEALLEIVVNKIKDDYSNSRDLIPFILCGELGSQVAELSDFTGGEDIQGLPSTFLFQPQGLVYGHCYLIGQKHYACGLLSTIQFCPFFDNNWANILREDATILCEGSAEVSARQDTEGNRSFEANVEVRDRTENGIEFSGGVSGRIERDSDGNTSGVVEAKGGIKW